MVSTRRVNRRSMRLPGYNYRWNGAYFVTVCAFRRATYFRDQRIAAIVPECWNAIPNHFDDARTDAFVVMPNHMHGIVWILQNGAEKVPGRYVVGAQHAAPLRSDAVHRRRLEAGSLSAIVRSLKSAVTRRVNEIRGPSPFWQRNYYERVIRSDAELEKVREYIALYPVKWHLDQENPDRLADSEYKGEWGWLEGDLVA